MFKDQLANMLRTLGLVPNRNPRFILTPCSRNIIVAKYQKSRDKIQRLTILKTFLLIYIKQNVMILDDTIKNFGIVKKFDCGFDYTVNREIFMWKLFMW